MMARERGAGRRQGVAGWSAAWAVALSAMLATTAQAGGGLASSALRFAPQVAPPAAAPLEVGVGIYDITGPAGDSTFMGYVRPDQVSEGIHSRLWARSFIVKSASGARLVFVSADICMVCQAVSQRVNERLRQLFGGLYGPHNVILSATHTHCAPGGYSHYGLYNITSGGYDDQNVAIVVSGITQSIIRAHQSLQPGRIKLGVGALKNASRNRSLTAYLQNPAAERARYPDDVDTAMTLLRFEDLQGRELGMFNWFAVHATNVGNTIKLISSDNKGFASWLFEKHKGGLGRAPGDFVAGFAQSNEGDASPNLWGLADGIHDFERMETIGRRHFDEALSVYQNAKVELSPTVDARACFVKFAGLKVDGRWVQGGQPTTLPRAAIGMSKLAGCEDGPGLGGIFKEGLVYGVNWLKVSLVPKDQKAHVEKPIALVTGKGNRPLTPEVLPIKVARIGELAIIAVPFECTTMVGRRLRETVLAELAPLGVNVCVIAGLSDAFAGYVTTREEYAVQHYEGASTHFGPFTCNGLRQELHRLASAMAAGQPVGAGPTPRVLNLQGRSRNPGPDQLPPGQVFGQVVIEAAAAYSRGAVASAVFLGGQPRNDMKLMGSFLDVERETASGFVAVCGDDAPTTRVRWRRSPRAETYVTVEWHIPAGTAPGRYRLVQSGHYQDSTGAVRPYRGQSRVFEVRP
jgi:neutral ceramidase